MQLLSLRSLDALEGRKNFFFKYYPFVLGNAVYTAFYYLVPGSRNLYTKEFRRIIYLQIAQLLTGIDVCPETVQVLREQLFPDEILEDDAEYSKGFEQRDGLPPLPRSADDERPVTGVLPTATPPAPVVSGGRAGNEGLDGGGDGDDDGGRGGSGGGGARAARPRGSPSQRSRAAAVGNSVGKSVGQSVGPTDNEATAALFAKDYNPIATYAGDRSGLRFRPTKPDEMLHKSLPRQARKVRVSERDGD